MRKGTTAARKASLVLAAAIAFASATTAFAAGKAPSTTLKKRAGWKKYMTTGFGLVLTSTAEAEGFELQFSEDPKFSKGATLEAPVSTFVTKEEPVELAVMKIGGERVATETFRLSTPAATKTENGRLVRRGEVREEFVVTADRGRRRALSGNLTAVWDDGDFVRLARADGEWTQKKSKLSIYGYYTERKEGPLYARARALKQNAAPGKWSKTFTLLKKPKAAAWKLPSSAALQVGETKKLAAAPSGKTKWKSADAGVAKVSSGGVVTGVAPGKTTISATANGKTKKCVVTVKKKAAKAKKPSRAAIEKKTAALLKKAGYSRKEVAAAMGNWMAESGLDPWMVEGKFGDQKYLQAYADSIVDGTLSRSGFTKNETTWSGGARPLGYGICQWTSASRKGALWDYAKKNGSDVTDLETQVNFAVKEMKAEGFGPGWAKGTKDLTEATHEYLTRYEGIDDGTTPTRAKYAKGFYAKYK